MERYIGTYQTFQTVSRKEAAGLIGADNLVGDRYQIDCTIEDGVQKAWLVNRFNQRIGYFEPAYSRQLSILKAQGMELVALLSFVAFTDHPEPGFYWGDMAVIAFDPTYRDAMEAFIERLSKEMGKGKRPRVNLDAKAVDQIIQSQGAWLPHDTSPYPAKEKGTALVKTRRSATDRLVEESRKGNKGCYLLSWAFLLALVAGIIFGLKACGIF
ncbi:hypothetical protein VIN30_01825 [Adlercreutzia sp. R7]|uniref:HIRAN domain-containing protein n=1 Tax=Adlercreutzia wanghongyangiae TaxID=3111451 RepID=A0ABU6IFH2_9ACTN|nr:hypothetical protein [Adlercreutzia sp. R7]